VILVKMLLPVVVVVVVLLLCLKRWRDLGGYTGSLRLESRVLMKG